MEHWKILLKEAAQAVGFSSSVDRFFFLRHGQTDYNLKKIVQGWTDIPLNATGEAQALEAASVLKQRGINAIITSPLLRARKTAEIVSAHIGASITALDPRLRERYFGDYENKPDPISVWERQDLGMETPEIFAKRVMEGMIAALQKECTLPLIVAHGGVRRMVLFALDLTLPPEAELNAVPLEFVRRGNVWSVFPLLVSARDSTLTDA